MQIQASIAVLEQKQEDIQIKVMENNTEIALKLNEIQATTTRLENKHEAIERTIKEAPKTYANIIKTTIINTKENPTAEIRARQRQQHDALRQERAKYEVTLTMKETNDEVKELINTMPPKEITERCQHAIQSTEMPYSKFKTFLRKVAARTIPSLNRAIRSFIPQLSPQECANYFRHAGYVSI